MTPEFLRDAIIENQQVHPELGGLYSMLNFSKTVILDFAFGDWRDRFTTGEIPILSLEVDREKWKGKFCETGPLGVNSVITINLSEFDTAEDIPKTIAHELAHWWDRPNTGHQVSFWDIMTTRVGIGSVGDVRNQWRAIRDHLPMETLRMTELLA